MPRPLCSLSLDLDDLWSYLKTHGDAGWEEYPSYLEIVVPRVLELLAARGLRITWFIVGRDAADPRHRDVLRSIADAGHEIGNHSFHHEPWLHLYSEAEIEAELARAEDAIEGATGVRPDGFRGPGFSFSPTLLNVLARRGYRYDCSTFPTLPRPAGSAVLLRDRAAGCPPTRSGSGVNCSASSRKGSARLARTIGTPQAARCSKSP